MVLVRLPSSLIDTINTTKYSTAKAVCFTTGGFLLFNHFSPPAPLLAVDSAMHPLNLTLLSDPHTEVNHQIKPSNTPLNQPSHLILIPR